MDLFEYQGKQYFARYDIPIPAGDVANTVDEAVAQAEKTGYPVVVKAQVQVGGRGKAGGIKLAANSAEVREHASNILGMDIKGHIVQRLWIEEASQIEKEYYASITLDRGAKLHLGMLSTQGGVDIEGVAETNPEAIARLHINPVDGLTEEICRQWVDDAGIDEIAKEGTIDILSKLYNCYVKGDAELVEINPLVLSKDGRVYALDAKVSLDDSAANRHPEWESFRAEQILDERDRQAKEMGLQYIGLDGFVGIIANGAGLAMSTLDTVAQVGGEAANFLDIGGGASADVVTNALTIINNDEKVKSILVNIFGGITKGEVVAAGIVEALKRVDLKAPMVIRLDGTNSEQGRAILQEHTSDKVQLASTMVEAATRAVELAGEK